MKNLEAILIAIIILNGCQQKSKDTMNKKEKDPLEIKKGHHSLPEITINKDEFTLIENLHFNHSVGGLPIDEETLVMMKYDEKSLEIKFECRDNPRMDQNFYIEDNTSLFNQEVFEIFISKGGKSLEDYIEIEINPNNALFLGKVSYRYKTDKEFSLKLVDNKEIGIYHEVIKDRKNNVWKGHLKIPLDFLKYPKNTLDNIYRINFYRIISTEDHTDQNWENNLKNATYGCWSSTMQKKPQFHAPGYFGFLVLD